MENIYYKILDIFFCSMIYTACHDCNCLLLLGCLLNAVIVLCCSSFSSIQPSENASQRIS